MTVADESIDFYVFLTLKQPNPAGTYALPDYYGF
jgi:hypothetical protein